MRRFLPVLLALTSVVTLAQVKANETLQPLLQDKPPDSLKTLWDDFDPTEEPLETETLYTWTEDDVELRVVRFRIGVFKGRKAQLAAIYGFPKSASEVQRVPGLLQIHGGGQYADHRACVANAKRGYATLSIAWAGRISAPNYRVSPSEVQLFWDGATDNPRYRLTTDWGVLDGYHAPGRNAGNQFPSVAPADWTFDHIESPRNSGWFLCALAARRGLTFLEQQPQVDHQRLGVYGHSMGGKLTVLTAVDSRVKAAVPSCGGISDRDNRSELFRATLGDDISLREIECPILFLSPSNDFHGRIVDLPQAIEEIKSLQWRVCCSPHHNHQDTAEYEVATLLWFDQHLLGLGRVPATPQVELQLATETGTPKVRIAPDRSRDIRSVDVFYTLDGKTRETNQDREQTVHRFWFHAAAEESTGGWETTLPLPTVDRPLWVIANVTYALDQPIDGAGYYYGAYTADKFIVSSLIELIPAERLQRAGVRATVDSTYTIESFEGDWQKEWFSYRPTEWSRSTHKLMSVVWRAPSVSDGAGANQRNVSLVVDVLTEKSNQLVLRLDEHVALKRLDGGQAWQTVRWQLADFQDIEKESLNSWADAKRLTLSPLERLRPGRNSQQEPRVVGASWSGPPPVFRNLRWEVTE